MGTVILKNGALESEFLVAIVMGKLERLVGERPFAFYDLVMRSRDREYQLLGSSEECLQALKLVGPDGGVHGSDRNVILSAVRGDGPDMVLGSPLS